MEERMNMLSEVSIQADRFTREQKLKAFREQFLGVTQAGRTCKIMNESDIRIWFNLQTNTLFVTSDQPIEVINEYLGYKTLFSLVDFRAEYYSHVTLNRDNVRQSFFAVTTSYTDLNPNDRRIKRRRDEIYDRSSTFFFKNLANNTLNESGFRIFRGGFPIDHNLYFTTKDTLSLKMIQLIPEMENINSATLPGIRISVRGNLSTEISSNFSVLYRRRQSDIIFYTDTILVDQYGNIDQIDKVMFSGLMGQNRAGDMLPLEYEP
jgi:hypothetical protein